MNAFFVKDWVVVGGDEHIVHIDDEPSFSEFFFENGVHHHLKGCWRISQSEEHYHGSVEAFVGNDGCFAQVSVSNSHVVVPPAHIELSEEGATPGFIDQLRYKG